MEYGTVHDNFHEIAFPAIYGGIYVPVTYAGFIDVSSGLYPFQH
jgi:hypothetical protein